MTALSDHGSAALSRLLELRPAAVVATHRRLGDATAVVEAADLVAMMTLLRDDDETAFEMLTDLTAVDWLGQEPRFELVYHLFSVERCHRLRVKAFASGEPPGIASLTAVWPSANWMEREVFDLYGVRFDGHPDLRRLLLYDEFEGHPLRKDYPKRGRQPLVGPSD